MRGAGENVDYSTGRGNEAMGLVLSSHDRNGGSYKRKSGVVKSYSCRGEGGLLLSLLFAGKQSE